jgi:hypothetical protein
VPETVGGRAGCGYANGKVGSTSFNNYFVQIFLSCLYVMIFILSHTYLHKHTHTHSHTHTHTGDVRVLHHGTNFFPPLYERHSGDGRMYGLESGRRRTGRTTGKWPGGLKHFCCYYLLMLLIL